MPRHAFGLRLNESIAIKPTATLGGVLLIVVIRMLTLFFIRAPALPSVRSLVLEENNRTDGRAGARMKDNPNEGTFQTPVSPRTLGRRSFNHHRRSFPEDFGLLLFRSGVQQLN